MGHDNDFQKKNLQRVMLPISSLQALVQDGLHVQGVIISIPVKQNALEEEWAMLSCMSIPS